jgi:DHA1 family multidrug resistance protein-like MFS transporter
MKSDKASWQKSLYAIFIAETIAIAGFSVSMPLLPFFIQDLGVTDNTKINLWVGLCNASGSLSLALIAPVWGKIADSYGRRLMLLRAMFGGSVGLFLIGLVNQPWQLLVLRTLQGTVTGTVAAANVLAASITPEDKRGYGLGLVQTSIFVGGAAGPMLGGIVADFWGIRAAFFVTSFCLMIGGVVIYRFVEEDFVKRPVTRTFWRTIIPNFSAVTQSRTLIVLLFVVGTVYISGSVISPILPLFIQSLTEDASTVGLTTGLIFGLGALSAAIASAALGGISYRIGYRRVLLICIVGATALYIPQAFVTAPWQLLVLRVIGGLFLGGTMPSANALIANRTEKSRQGEIYGLSSSVGSGGMALGPIVGASVSIVWGYRAVFIVTAFILLVTAAVLVLARGTKKHAG